MDYRTAAAIAQNISGIADAFVQMNDPARRARANQMMLQTEGLGLQNEGLRIANEFARPRLQGEIDLTKARIATEGSQQGYYGAMAGKANSETDINKLKLQAGQFLAPFTTYSKGGAAGPDEMTDPWTEKGYTATGQNLTEGVVAVNPGVHPLGTVFRNPQTGEVFVAADKHGNSDPNVVDLFRTPQTYKPEKGQMPLEVVGRETLKYGTTAEQIQAIRDRYARAANVFAGAGADDLAQAQARNAMLAAGDNEQAGRNAAAAISGQLPGAGEYSTQSAADAFQQRALAADYQKAVATELLQQQGLTGRKLLGGTSTGDGGSASGASGVSMVKPVHEMLASRFGSADESGNLTISPDLRPAAGAWQTTFANLVDSGVSPVKAEVIADQHHSVQSVGMVDPWFGAPRMQAGEAFNFNPISPEEASAYAPAPAAGVPVLPSLASLFGGADAPAAPAIAPAEPAAPQVAPSAVPQTGADSEASQRRGRALGTEQLKAEAQKSADKGTAWNSATLGNVLRAIQVTGTPLEDVIATALAGDENNDLALQRILMDGASRGLGVVRSGGLDPKNLRNALRDVRALQAAGIDPAMVTPFLNSSPEAEIQNLVDQYRTR